MIHLFHPLFGQVLEVVDRRSLQDGERVYLEVAPGRIERLDLAWTSLGPTDPFVAISAGRSLLRVAELVELCGLVACLQEGSKNETSR